MTVQISREFPWTFEELLDMDWDDFLWYYEKAGEILEEKERQIRKASR